jgi:ATP-dependent RNA helicase DeaD
MVVLDEADEMLDMGFLEDIQKIFEFLPKTRQTLLFSATMPLPIKKLADKILNNPVHIKVESKDNVNKDIEQRYYVIEEYEREAAVVRLIESQEPSKAIIFCRTKREVDELSLKLAAQGYTASSLHGDMEQNKRREVMASFRANKFNILVATDVAARGLDISDMSHVFNYHIPFDPESYVHRIGRTGRAGKKGIAITLVTPIEYRQLQRIERIVGGKMQLCTVPTLSDLRKSQADKLIESIRKQPLDESASDVLEALEDEMDINHLAYKLVSMLLERETIIGPDAIGLQEKDVLRLKDKFTGDGRRGSDGRSRRGRNSGNSRSNSNNSRPGGGSGRKASDSRERKPRKKSFNSPTK